MTICTRVHNANHNVHCVAVKVYKFTLPGCDIHKRLLALPVCAVVKVYLKILPGILCILSNNTYQTQYFSTMCILFYSSSKSNREKSDSPLKLDKYNLCQRLVFQEGRSSYVSVW